MENAISALYSRLLAPPTQASEKRAQVPPSLCHGLTNLACPPCQPSAMTKHARFDCWCIQGDLF